MKEVALVVPSIREESFDRFCREWTATGLFDKVDLILMEDNPTRTFTCPVRDALHLSWEDIDRHDFSWIIPRRSDTVRSFGYWKAHDLGYEYLMTLDDDCYPAEGYEDLVGMHLSMLSRTKWFNTLNCVRPRGVPYFNLGERKVYVNHGIWQGVLDYDAPQQLVNPVPETYTHDNRIVPHGAYHPFCGMNVMWRREAMVLSYHLLMGHSVDGVDSKGRWPDSRRYDSALALKKLQFDRFGDIWCGIVQKKICDYLGWAVSTGTPYIHHDRASNPFTNLRKEAAGIEVNEWFWERIDAIELPRAVDGVPLTADECYSWIGDEVSRWGGEHQDYWKTLGHAMSKWADLF